MVRYIIIIFSLLICLLLLLAYLKVREGFCLSQEVTINYNNKDTCFTPGNYNQTNVLFPDVKECKINTGFNTIDIYKDTNFNTYLYTLHPGTDKVVSCNPGSLKVY